jgi:hypothetical protein
MRYRADITAGALKVRETRLIAGLLLKGLDEAQWRRAVVEENILQTRSVKTAERLCLLIRGRLSLMKEALWLMVRDGSKEVATHATFAAAVKHSALLADFMDLELREQYQLYSPKIPSHAWGKFVDECRGRDTEMPRWSDSTIDRLRSSVYQMLADAGYLKSSRSLELQSVHFSPEVEGYLVKNGEHYVLRCVSVSV